MKKSWRPYLRRLARVCVVGAATAWSSAVCYAQLAADNASNPAYADGWQGTTTNNTTGVQETTGDNGGFGFEPWNFDTDWLFNPDPIDGIQDVNPGTSTFNQIGTAWRMGLPEPTGDPLTGGLPRAGRGFAPLQTGQTFSLVFDNPTERTFFKGYFIRFNSRHGAGGGGNISYEYPGYSHAASAADLNGDGYNVPLSGVDPSPKIGLNRFEYANDGKWSVASEDGSNDSHEIDLFDFDTALAGARLDLTIIGPDQYQLTIDPFGPAPTHVETGTLMTPGAPLDWIEFTFFNQTPSDPLLETDLYIRGMKISGPTGPTGDFGGALDVSGDDFLAWQRGFGKTTGARLGEGDGNGDGAVNTADFTTWKAQFGAPPAAPVASGVPEPGTAALIVCAAGVAWASISRVRRREAS